MFLSNLGKLKVFNALVNVFVQQHGRRYDEKESVLLAVKRPSGSVPQAQCRRIHALKVTTAIKRPNVSLVIAERSLRRR